MPWIAREDFVEHDFCRKYSRIFAAVIFNTLFFARLPFGRTEHFSQEPDLSFLQSTSPTRSSRAISEPRGSHHGSKPRRSSHHATDRAKSAERSVVSRRKKASAPVGSDDAWEIIQDLKKQENKHLYRLVRP